MNDRRFQINWHTSQIAAADSLIRGNAANSLRSLLDEQIREHSGALLSFPLGVDKRGKDIRTRLYLLA